VFFLQLLPTGKKAKQTEIHCALQKYWDKASINQIGFQEVVASFCPQKTPFCVCF
jgi:hypothetical protein